MEMWKASKEVVDRVQEMIREYHPDLVIVMDEIAIVFKEKAAKRGGKVILGKASKANPLFSSGVLSEQPWKFIIELPADEWETLGNRKQSALLDRHLCACRTEENAETGELKCSIAPPDVAYYWDELDRWGDWHPREEGDEDKPNIINVLSGATDGAAAVVVAEEAEE